MWVDWVNRDSKLLIHFCCFLQETFVFDVNGIVEELPSLTEYSFFNFQKPFWKKGFLVMFCSYFLKKIVLENWIFRDSIISFNFFGQTYWLQWNSCFISWNYCANRTCRNVIGDLVQECERVVPTVLFAWWRFSSGFPHHIPRFVRWPKKITNNFIFVCIRYWEGGDQPLGHRKTDRIQKRGPSRIEFPKCKK